MISIAFVEDEEEVQNMLRSYLERYNAEHGNPFSKSEFFSSGEDFLASGKTFHLLCLDIDLKGGIDGMEVARRVREHDDVTAIVFITNLAQYALEGYQVQALDYVLKPLSYTDFAMKLSKAQRIIERYSNNRPLLLETVDGKKELVNLKDVEYVEVRKHYLTYHTVNGDCTIRSSMRAEESRLSGDSFFRINSYLLLNLFYLRSVDGDDVILKNGKRLPISRSRKTEFLTYLARYIGGLKS